MANYNELSWEDKRKVDECRMIEDKYGYTRWGDIMDIAQSIEDEDYRKHYVDVAKRLYHMEEGKCGMI